MSYCSKCGSQISEETRFCGVCGAPTDGSAPAYNEARDTEENKGMGILAYLGPLVFIPMFAAKNSKFARFHTVQGFNLFVLDLANGILGGIINAMFFAFFWGIGWLLSLLLSFVWVRLRFW